MLLTDYGIVLVVR